MSNHLPECRPESVQIPCPDGKPGCAVYHTERRRIRCICPELAACERRKDEERYDEASKHFLDGKAKGYTAALDKADAAVLALVTPEPRWDDPLLDQGWTQGVSDALAALSRLRDGS